jgi:hypothetical protein
MPNSTNNKVVFYLNENNEISLQLSIEGTTSVEQFSKPDVRFVLEDKSLNGISWIYPPVINEDKTINVSVYGNESFLSEGKQYRGKLEVIIGNRYFCPQEFDVEFKKPLRVESKIIQNPGPKKESPSSIPTKTTPSVAPTTTSKPIVVKNQTVPTKVIVEQTKQKENPQKSSPLKEEKNQLKNLIKNVLFDWNE